MQRVDLFGGAHGADFSRDARGHPARQHQGGDDRSQLSHNAHGDDVGHKAFRVKTRAAGIDVERQRRAGEQRRQPHHRQGEKADLDDLLDQLTAIIGWADHGRQRMTGEQGDGPC